MNKRGELSSISPKNLIGRIRIAISAIVLLLSVALPIFADSQSYNFYFSIDDIPEVFTITQIESPDEVLTYTVDDTGKLNANLSSAKNVDIANLQLQVWKPGLKQFTATLSPIDQTTNTPYFASGNGRIYYNLSFSLGNGYYEDFSQGRANINRTISDGTYIGSQMMICTFRIAIDQASFTDAPAASSGSPYTATMTITFTEN